MAVLIPGTLFLMWAELAGDRAWWRMKIPRRPAFWAVSIAVAASLPLFMNFSALAGLLQITSISARDWAIAAALSILPVLWRIAGIPAARPLCRIDVRREPAPYCALRLRDIKRIFEQPRHAQRVI
jgi:hypothetical protein